MWLLFYYCLYFILKYKLSLVLTSWPLFFADLPDQGQQLGRRLRLGLKRIQIRIFSMVANQTFKPQRCFTGNSHFLVVAHIPYLFSRCLRLFLLGQGEVLVVRRNEGGVTIIIIIIHNYIYIHIHTDIYPSGYTYTYTKILYTGIKLLSKVN